mgnify:CR=1 FL=1
MINRYRSGIIAFIFLCSSLFIFTARVFRFELFILIFSFDKKNDKLFFDQLFDQKVLTNYLTKFFDKLFLRKHFCFKKYFSKLFLNGFNLELIFYGLPFLTLIFEHEYF